MRRSIERRGTSKFPIATLINFRFVAFTERSLASRVAFRDSVACGACLQNCIGRLSRVHYSNKENAKSKRQAQSLIISVGL